MKNFKETLDYQQKVNEAVKAIFHHFNEEISYAETLERISDAQFEIMQLMEMNRIETAQGEVGISTESINSFMFEVHEMQKLLRPFANLIGQVYGIKD